MIDHADFRALNAFVDEFKKYDETVRSGTEAAIRGLSVDSDGLLRILNNEEAMLIDEINAQPARDQRAVLNGRLAALRAARVYFVDERATPEQQVLVEAFHLMVVRGLIREE